MYFYFYRSGVQICHFKCLSLFMEKVCIYGNKTIQVVLRCYNSAEIQIEKTSFKVCLIAKTGFS